MPSPRSSTRDAEITGRSRAASSAALVVAMGIAFTGWTSLPVAAQEQPPPTGGLTLASEMELARLVDLVAERLSLSIEYDPQSLKGTVALRRPQGIPDSELWPLTNRLLASRGFTTVRLPGDTTMSVVRLEAAAGLARVEPVDVPLGAFPPGYQSILVRVQYRSSREVAEAVRGVLSKNGGQVVELGTSGAPAAKTTTGGLLMVSDVATRLDQARAVAAMLDVKGSLAGVEEYRPTLLSATTLAQLVGQVVLKQESTTGLRPVGDVIPSPSGENVLIIAPPDQLQSWRDLVRTLDAREPVETHTYLVERFAVDDVQRLIDSGVRSAQPEDERFRAVPDPLSSSIAVTATRSQHDKITELFERLGRIEQVSLPVRTFAVRNRPVAELLDALTKLLDAGVLGDTGGSLDAREAVRSGSSQRSSIPVTSPLLGGDSASQPAGTAAQPAGSAAANRRNTAAGSASLRLTADESTNSLVALGDPMTLARLEQLIQTLDVRQPQVMLDVTLVSMNESDAINFGVELERLGSIGSAPAKIASLFGLSTAGSSGDRTVPDSTGFVGAVLDPGEFSVVVKALQSINAGNSLSNPKVLVTNNQQAVFSSTLQQPFQTQTRTGSSDTTTGYGGSDSAGTTISVRPQIARGDHLVLTYSIKLSSFVGSPTVAGLPPPKQENSVDSMATIPDGHTVVVGGLELIGGSDAESRVPLIGRLPLLGHLFKSQSKSASRTQFFVFIRPNIMRSESFEDLKYISGQEAQNSNIDDGFPKVTPRMIR